MIGNKKKVTHRIALLVVAMMVTVVLAAPMVAAWYTTPVQTWSFGSLYNVGGSTQYGYSGPATDTHPQFYVGGETHTLGSSVWPTVIKITVTGTDPKGVTLAGNRFGSLSALISPNSYGQTNQVMSAIYNALLNVLPYGIGSDIQNLQSNPTSPGYDSTSAWAVWNTGAMKQTDAGLQFGFTLAVDPTLSGTYHLQIDIKFTTMQDGRPPITRYHDVYDNVVYCYNVCTTNDDFENTASWTGSTSGGSSFIASAVYGYSTTASHTPTHSVNVGFTGGAADGTDYGNALMYRDLSVSRVNYVAVNFDMTAYSHNGNSWDSMYSGIRMRLYNSGGTNYATYEYWLMTWYQGGTCKTPGTNQVRIYCQPTSNTWIWFGRDPNSDWTINWSGCTKVRFELFTSAVGTNGDNFRVYFDDFAMS